MGMLGMCLTGSVAAAPGTDVVVLANGDRITGEIKGLERGLLTLKTDALGTVEIEWAKIGRIETQQLLEIEDSAHKRYLGQVVGTGEDGSLQIAPSRGGVRLPAAGWIRSWQWPAWCGYRHCRMTRGNTASMATSAWA